MGYLTSDVQSLLHELDLFAADLSNLTKSVEVTALELRFAMLRAMIEDSLGINSSNDNAASESLDGAGHAS
ncbi:MULTISPECIES: hypothetical protein [unclassified Rhizobium]|jgi:hypothetical protein|uniref:hypothetical protein n=1 Tax=unclassified Rhizobium TaxID=2613769 RepID=UPI000DD7D3E0|nr:hypothetical protein [Rhizobium sp. BG4]QRM46539.1 hypothetical protein F2982_24515 [Rhizobium sp. BG4]